MIVWQRVINFIYFLQSLLRFTLIFQLFHGSSAIKTLFASLEKKHQQVPNFLPDVDIYVTQSSALIFSENLQE